MHEILITAFLVVSVVAFCLYAGMVLIPLRYEKALKKEDIKRQSRKHISSPGSGTEIHTQGLEKGYNELKHESDFE